MRLVVYGQASNCQWTYEADDLIVDLDENTGYLKIFKNVKGVQYRIGIHARGEWICCHKDE